MDFIYSLRKREIQTLNKTSEFLIWGTEEVPVPKPSAFGIYSVSCPVADISSSQQEKGLAGAGFLSPEGLRSVGGCGEQRVEVHLISIFLP